MRFTSTALVLHRPRKTRVKLFVYFHLQYNQSREVLKLPALSAQVFSPVYAPLSTRLTRKVSGHDPKVGIRRAWAKEGSG